MRDLASVSQTFFLDDSRVGAALLVALVAFEPRIALSAVFVGLTARLAAERLPIGRNLIQSGALTLNGWFTGAAVGAFFAPTPGLLAALPIAAALTIAATVVCERLISPWQLPLLVAPYMPAFTLVWLAFSGLPWIQIAEPQALTAAANSWELIGLGTLRSIGQIFFTQDARFGAVVLAILTIRKARLGVAMLGSSTAAVVLAWAFRMPNWQIEQGLHGFAPALMAAAWITGFKNLKWTALAGATIASPFLELAVLKVGANVGIFGLSTTYLILVWATLLLRPVQEGGGLNPGWGKLGQGFSRA